MSHLEHQALCKHNRLTSIKQNGNIIDCTDPVLSSCPMCQCSVEYIYSAMDSMAAPKIVQLFIQELPRCLYVFTHLFYCNTAKH